MASIKKSPELPDYFVEMDWNDRKRDPIGFSEALVRHYEDGEIVILRNSPIVADYALLNHVSLPKGLAYKKIRDDYFTRPRLNLESLRLHRYLFQHYPTKYRAICREVTRASNAIREIGQQLFPHYRFTKMPCSWRFTPTGPEHMHIDHFGALGDEEEKWYLRIFLNVDEQPRLWKVSHTLSGLAERYYQDAGMEKWCQGRGSDFSRELSRWIYGGKEKYNNEKVHESSWPHHEIEWATGDVWILDSRLHSHQVVQGRRMMATGFEVDPTSMQSPDKSLDSRVRVIHERHLAQEQHAS
jgi:hypothetical protein